MKKVIVGAALCSAAVAFASPANADSDSGFWTAAATAISDWLLGSGGAASSAASPVGPTDTEFLAGSTHALILGATGLPTPTATYISEAGQLYLDPSGYDGTNASMVALTTPETFTFGSSLQQGETILINAILADYQAGEMGCNTAGVCSDPLTIFTYSQSSAIAALAEHQLGADNIPTDALRFVMLGANPTGVPDNLYPTEVYNIDGDLWAQPGSIGTTWQEVLLGLGLHEAYLGLTQAQINSATTIVEGMTTIHEIPTLTFTGLWDALLNVWFGQ
jgi:PE-PPE domain